MGDKTKEQLLEELTEVQKMLEERTEIQGHMIRKLRMLIGNEGLFSQVIDLFPYPIAIFTPQYTLDVTNKAFAAETKTSSFHPEKMVTHILQHLSLSLNILIQRMINRICILPANTGVS